MSDYFFFVINSCFLTEQFVVLYYLNKTNRDRFACKKSLHLSLYRNSQTWSLEESVGMYANNNCRCMYLLNTLAMVGVSGCPCHLQECFCVGQVRCLPQSPAAFSVVNPLPSPAALIPRPALVLQSRLWSSSGTFRSRAARYMLLTCRWIGVVKR